MTASPTDRSMAMKRYFLLSRFTVRQISVTIRNLPIGNLNFNPINIHRIQITSDTRYTWITTEWRSGRKIHISTIKPSVYKHLVRIRIVYNSVPTITQCRKSGLPVIHTRTREIPVKLMWQIRHIYCHWRVATKTIIRIRRRIWENSVSFWPYIHSWKC